MLIVAEMKATSDLYGFSEFGVFFPGWPSMSLNNLSPDQLAGAILVPAVEGGADDGIAADARNALVHVRRRRRLARQLTPAIALATAVTAAVGALWSRDGSGATIGGPAQTAAAISSHEPILVTRFDNATGEADLDRALEYALERELTAANLRVAAPKRVEDALRLMRKPADTVIDLAIGREICLRDGGIRTLITGRVERNGPRYILTLQIIDPRGGQSIATLAEEAAARTQLPEIMRRFAYRTREAIGEPPLATRALPLE